MRRKARSTYTQREANKMKKEASKQYRRNRKSNTHEKEEKVRKETGSQKEGRQLQG